MYNFDYVIAHCSWVSKTGYSQHSRDFFTRLNNFIPVRVHNFSHMPELSHLSQLEKDMTIYQEWGEPPWKIGTPFKPKPLAKILNIILLETNHFWYFNEYKGPTIAYNVWESTRQPDAFFKRLLNFEQLWVPSTWQRDCSIEQGYPQDRVKVVPEGVDGSTFFPEDISDKDGRFKFLIFGRWDDRKYIMEMIRGFLETFDKKEPVDLIISVDNPFSVDGMHSTEERLKYHNLVDSRVKVLHYLPRKEYIRYMKKGNVLLCVSRSEGWNLPLIEAIACGTPTITTNWGAPLDFAKDVSLLVNVKDFAKPDKVFMQPDGTTPGVWSEPDYDHMKLLMREVYENYIDCKKKAVEKAKKVSEKFSWDNAVQIALETINTINARKFYPVKIDVGSGIKSKGDGYIKIDKYDKNADIQADILLLPFENGSVDEVVSSHMIEHLSKMDVHKALKEMHRVLSYDGKLSLEVPDFEWCIKNFLEKGENERWDHPINTIFGLQENEGEYHKTGFTKDRIKLLLNEVGFYNNNIKVEDVFSHEQQCMNVTAYKKKIEYNDDVFFLDCYTDTEEKEKLLLNTIQKLKKYNKPIIIVTHYPVSSIVQKEVDHIVYDSKNVMSENWNLNWWWVRDNFLKIVSSYEQRYHAVGVYSSLKNGCSFAKNKFNFAHFIEYDIDVDLDKYLENVNEQRANGKDFIFFPYSDEQNRRVIIGLIDKIGIVTNLFSFNIKLMDDCLVPINSWEEYRSINEDIAKRIGPENDLIFENWLYMYFKDKGIFDNGYFFSSDLKKEIIINRNIIDQGKKEPGIKILLSETYEEKPIIFAINTTEKEQSIIIKYNGKEIKNIVPGGDITYLVLPEKKGTVTVKINHDERNMEFHQTTEYTRTKFKFYDDRIICRKWEGSDSLGFDKDKENQIYYTFIDGAKIEILGHTKEKYHVKFIDNDTDVLFYEWDIENNNWSSPNKRYFVNWKCQIEKDNKVISEHLFDLKGKKVCITLNSKSLGDTLAWVPYIEEFRKKYNCIIYAITFWNDLYKNEYKDIIFMSPGNKIKNLYASYTIGCYDNDYSKNKNNWRVIPLQQVATDYLGLDYIEIKPKITRSIKPRPIPEKYVCIAEYSTFQCKHWLHPGGWQTIVDYLNSIGYKVMVISKESTKLKNVIKNTGNQIEETVRNIQYADIFVGVSSGPAWVAWGLNVPTVMISGFSPEYSEMHSCERVINKNVCNSCVSDLSVTFDRGNWMWCPRNKKFECMISITPDMVKKAIHNALKT